MGRPRVQGGTQCSPCAHELARAGRGDPAGSGYGGPCTGAVPPREAIAFPALHPLSTLGLMRSRARHPSPPVPGHPQAARHPECPGKGSFTVLRSGPGPWCYRQREQAGSGDPASCWVRALGPVPGLGDPGGPGSGAPGWTLGTSAPLCAAENLFCVSRFSLQRRFLSRSLVLYTLTESPRFVLCKDFKTKCS